MANLDGAKAKKQLDTEGAVTVSLSDGDIQLAEEDLLIETTQVEGYTTLSDRGVTVVLDTRLTDGLIEEGFVREIISKIQSMRKEADFDVMDHITVYQKGSEKVAQILTAHANEIKHDVLAVDIVTGQMDGFTMDWNINGEDTQLGVEVYRQ